MNEIDIRRNDYIASIRSDISDIRTSIAAYDGYASQCLELIELCKGWNLRKFRRVAKLEYKLLKKKHKWEQKRLKGLIKLLYKAEKYTPGSNRR